MMDERVSDPLDRAAQLEEAERATAALFRKPVLKRTGHCYNCGEAVPPEALFCDGECRHQHEVVQAAKARNGRR